MYTKYLDILRAWYFWLIIVVLSVYRIISDLQLYGNLFFVEYLGIFVGNFVIVLIIFSIIFGVSKLRKKKK